MVIRGDSCELPNLPAGIRPFYRRFHDFLPVRNAFDSPVFGSRKNRASIEQKWFLSPEVWESGYLP